MTRLVTGLPFLTNVQGPGGRQTSKQVLEHYLPAIAERAMQVVFGKETNPRSPMIIFRRKKRDQIVINDNIIVTVMNIRGSRVSLGIEAPDGVRILRSELEPHQLPAHLSLGDSAMPHVNRAPAAG